MTRNTEYAPRTTLTASGTIEAATLDIASPAAGRIAGLHVSEGQQVAAGDLIAEMDTTLLDAEIVQARAARAIAEAQLAQLKAGAREADLAVARAGVAQAEAARDAAKTAWEDALALVDAPNDLDVRIAGAAAAEQVAAAQVVGAQAAATAADLQQALWGRIVKLLEEGFDVTLPIPGGGTRHVDAPANRLSDARLQWNLASQQTWEAHARAAAALVARDAARQTLADLRGQRADPQNLRGQADAAGAAYAIATAAVGTAQAAVDVIQAGAPAEQIAALQAAVDQAEAAIRSPLARRAQARIVAPQAGTVTSVVRHAGEVVGPGTPIVRLADLSEVTLTVYVPETRLGQVQLGGDGAGRRGLAIRSRLLGHGVAHRRQRRVHAEKRTDERGTGQTGLPGQDHPGQSRQCAEARDARGRVLRGHGDRGTRATRGRGDRATRGRSPGLRVPPSPRRFSPAPSRPTRLRPRPSWAAASWP